MTESEHPASEQSASEQPRRTLSRTFVTGLIAGAVLVAASATGVWAFTSSDEDTPGAGSEHTHDHDQAAGAEEHGTEEHADEGMDEGHDHGLVIHDSTGGREPTEEDEANADAFYDEVVAGVARYQDIAVAIADGYTVSPNDAAQSISHYMKRGVNGAALDPEVPSGLVYYEDENQALLIGVVWTTQTAEPSQPGGPLTVWHDHSSMGCPVAHPDCPAATGGAGAGNPPKMFHVWLFEGAQDRFGHSFVVALGQTRPAGQSPTERPPLPFDD